MRLSDAINYDKTLKSVGSRKKGLSKARTLKGLIRPGKNKDGYARIAAGSHEVRCGGPV